MNLSCLADLIRFFFVRVGDLNTAASAQLKVIIEYCVNKSVESAESAEQVFENDVITMIFSAIAESAQSRQFVDFMFKDLLEAKLDIEQISEHTAERQ